MNKRKIIVIICFAVSIIVLIILTTYLYSNCYRKSKFENSILSIHRKNIDDVFSINHIAFFSSAYADTSVNSNSTTNIENLFQYTDIAIFLDNDENNITLKNSIKSLSIKNVKIVDGPELGDANLYYKNINDFTKPLCDEKNIINSSLDFIISSEDEADFNQPVIFNNCANPIVLSFVNSNIKDIYTLDSTDNTITYDGTLLKKCNIPLKSIKSKLEFDIYIENNLNQNFKCSISFDILLNDEKQSIYDGKYVLQKNTNYKLYRYE